MNRNGIPIQPRFKQALVIDDDEVDNFITRRVLKSAGFAESIEVKSSGPEALNYMKALITAVKKLPDVIFLDITMPGMDGFKFLEAFQQLKGGIKMDSMIIVLTNSMYAVEPGILHPDKNPMIHSVLLKPLSLEALQKIS